MEADKAVMRDDQGATGGDRGAMHAGMIATGADRVPVRTGESRRLPNRGAARADRCVTLAGRAVAPPSRRSPGAAAARTTPVPAERERRFGGRG
jgi:hypothetical protein